MAIGYQIICGVLIDVPPESVQNILERMRQEPFITYACD